MKQSGILFKLTHMPKDLLIRRLLSFEDHYVTVFRRTEDGKTLPHDTERPFAPVFQKKGYWYADPMLFERDGRTWLFVEAFDRRKQLGGVGCLCMDEPGSEPEIVLQEDFHMSFPHVFDWNGEVWMIPETGNDHSLRLYRAEEFPRKWKLEGRIPTAVDLVDSVVTDTAPDRLTILTSEFHDERQYFYRYHKITVVREAEQSFSILEDEAFLEKQEFSYRARNAGSLYVENGKRMLPTQESTPVNYGAMMRFVNYDPDETDVFAHPEGDPVRVADIHTEKVFDGTVRHKFFGVHSYARAGGYEVVDLKYMVFSPLKYPARIARRLLGR